MQTTQDVADTKSWEEYEKFLNRLPRAERRRILHAHLKRIKLSETESIRARDMGRRIAKLRAAHVLKRPSALENSNKRER